MDMKRWHKISVFCSDKLPIADCEEGKLKEGRERYLKAVLSLFSLSFNLYLFLYPLFLSTKSDVKSKARPNEAAATKFPLLLNTPKSHSYMGQSHSALVHT
ncbi:hypothetical protein VNO77_20737 [Canavalia gladiata]|uniref:Uncharacterized protein n=1 Tax=Canavalia gladiata TaxID=3824 RepID=A0AAN9LPT0_CANGL